MGKRLVAGRDIVQKIKDDYHATRPDFFKRILQEWSDALGQHPTLRDRIPFYEAVGKAAIVLKDIGLGDAPKIIEAARNRIAVLRHVPSKSKVLQSKIEEVFERELYPSQKLVECKAGVRDQEVEKEILNAWKTLLMCTPYGTACPIYDD